MPSVPEGSSPPLTAVFFQMEHGYGLPMVSTSGECDSQDASRLGLSPDLVDRLAAWGDRWETLAMRRVRREPWSDSSRRDEAELALDQWVLADALRRELPDDVELFVDGVPFDEWRAEQRRRR